MQPTELIDQLEAVERGERVLSAAVLRALGWQWEPMGCPGGGMWHDADHRPRCGPLPAVTERIEAARGLLPAALKVTVHQDRAGVWQIELGGHESAGVAGPTRPSAVMGRAKTLPLALCAAALRAQRTGTGMPSNGRKDEGLEG